MKNKKIKFSSIILAILFMFFLVLFIISLINIIKWSIDAKKTNEQIVKLDELVNIEKIKDSDKTNIYSEDPNKDNPYWKYIKMNLINVNFKELKAINDDTVGWIQVNNTNINYPIVRATDNEFYLTHSFDKSWNDAGWVFMDYRNKIVNDKNTIIYAHSRLDKTMFGTLRNILKSDWINNSDNYVIKLSTEEENSLWQVFSVYKIPATSDYIRTDFRNNDDFNDFVNLLINRSDYNFNTFVNGNDRIITLSTCYDDHNRVVLHAKLIKNEKR